MSYENELDRIGAGLPPTTLKEMILKYVFWIIVGGGLFYFFDIDVFQYLRF